MITKKQVIKILNKLCNKTILKNNVPRLIIKNSKTLNAGCEPNEIILTTHDLQYGTVLDIISTLSHEIGHLVYIKKNPKRYDEEIKLRKKIFNKICMSTVHITLVFLILDSILMYLIFRYIMFNMLTNIILMVIMLMLIFIIIPFTSVCIMHTKFPKEFTMFQNDEYNADIFSANLVGKALYVNNLRHDYYGINPFLRSLNTFAENHKMVGHPSLENRIKNVERMKS